MLFLPQIWVRSVMKKYARNVDSLPGTGGQLAEHLVNRFEMGHVQIEQTEEGNDHYDPKNKTIRLSEVNLNGQSLTAVAVATHEFSHALQDKTNYRLLKIRTYLAKFTSIAEKIASFLLVSSPMLAILTKSPLVAIGMLLPGFMIMGLPVLLHLVTLPVEFDASFNRALPILKEGNYLPRSAIPAVHKILTAAALTYFAASLASLLNFYRWIAILRR